MDLDQQKKKFMDLLKQVKKVYVPPMHFTLLETKQSRSSASGCNMNRTAAPGVQDARRRDRGSSSCRVRGCKRAFSKAARFMNDKAGNGGGDRCFQVQISSLFITPMGFIYPTESS